MVWMAFHFQDACANWLTNPAFDPDTQTAEYKACAVTNDTIGGSQIGCSVIWGLASIRRRSMHGRRLRSGFLSSNRRKIRIHKPLLSRSKMPGQNYAKSSVSTYIPGLWKSDQKEASSSVLRAAKPIHQKTARSVAVAVMKIHTLKLSHLKQNKRTEPELAVIPIEAAMILGRVMAGEGISFTDIPSGGNTGSLHWWGAGDSRSHPLPGSP